MNMDGDLGFALTSSKVTIPETWGVYFRCSHGAKFAVDGSSKEYKELWERLDPGMNVDIEYKEVFNSRYEDQDKDGELELVKTEMVDYDFITATQK